MKYRIQPLHQLILFMLVAAFSLGCSCDPGSTNTGNPDQPPVTRDLRSTFCTTLNFCHEIDATDCIPSIDNLTNIGPEIGLIEPAASLPFIEIEELEIQGDIIPDQNAAGECINAIQVLDCTASEVVNAYDPMDPENFDNVINLLDASNQCAEIF